jgi:aldehyde:ferredoxin oxidoreductase
MPEIGLSEPEDQFANEKKGMAAAKYQDWAAVFNSLTQCIIYPFFGMDLSTQLDLLNALNGWDMTAEDLIKTGERINTVQHLINLDRGLTVKDMKIPKRILEPLSEGATLGHVPDINVQLKEFFITRGWDENGIPSQERLKELNIAR